MCYDVNVDTGQKTSVNAEIELSIFVLRENSPSCSSSSSIKSEILIVFHANSWTVNVDSSQSRWAWQWWVRTKKTLRQSVNS